MDIYSDTFDRINNDIHYNKKFKPYKKSFLKKILIYFEDQEEFEKCQVIKNFIDVRFDHEINYKNADSTPSNISN